MPIDKSSPWGEEVASSGPAVELQPTFTDERSLSSTLTETGLTEIRLTGGDFVKLTGGHHGANGRPRRYPCDALRISGITSRTMTIGTVELRRRRRRLFGGFLIVSNLGIQGAEQYSSRSHPNDGKFEVVDALDGLSWRERLVLSRRFTNGVDFSHPQVRQRQATFYVAQESLHVYVDGAYCGMGVVEIEIRPDFLLVHV